jgi:hypothetical protein
MDEDAPIIAYVEQGLAIGFSCPHGLHCLAKQRRAMTIVRRLWRAAKYGVWGIASFGGLAGFAFVAGGFVWGIAKRITGTMSDPSGWNEWLDHAG